MANIAKLSMSEMVRLSRDLGLQIVGPHGMLHAYDGQSRRLILFSGVRGDSSCELAASWIFQDTWAWDGNGWTKLHPASSPLGRSFGAFAFDAHRGETVLFGGGSANSDLQRLDTWVWDGTNWRMKRPVTYPSAPAGSATYDASLSGVVALTDRAWLWDGTNWAAMPGDVPTGAWQYALADDPAHHQLVLYGTFARSTGTSYETWTWDGAAWQLRRPAHPPAAGTPYAAYDPVHNDVLMFDGATYSWNGVDWTQEHPAISPRPRLFASMAYDAAIGRIVLFGGKSVDRDAAGQARARLLEAGQANVLLERLRAEGSVPILWAFDPSRPAKLELVERFELVCPRALD